MRLVLKSTLAVAVAASVLASGFAYAGAEQELVVRFAKPQNDHQSAVKALFSISRESGAVPASKVEILNSEEGVVKLSFKDSESAARAMANLQASGQIENVAPNLLYRMALSLKVREAAPVQALARYLAVPFMSVSATATQDIPEVELPPAQTAGLDPLVRNDWAYTAIDMPTKAQITQPNKIVTAVIDTGVDYNHEDLSAAMWRSPSNDKEVGYDFAHGNAQPYDLVNFDVEGCLKDAECSVGVGTEKFLSNPGHGTHCAGHVGAVAYNSKGIRGMSEGGKVMALKFFYDAGEENAGQGDDAAAIKSIDYAIKNGAKVISASWGGRMSRSIANRSELKRAIDRARKAGVLFVVAAGNDAIDQDGVADPVFPAAYNLDNMIVVAAVDKEDNLAEFSSYGAKSVHIGAPGVKILSTTSGGKYSDVVAQFKDAKGNDRAIDWDGTSMATPVVAGAVSLVWSQHPNETYKQIKARILNSARKVPALDGKVSTGGVLDVAQALK